MPTSTDNQTQFAQVSPILESEVNREDPEILRLQALKRRKIKLIVVSVVVILITVMFLLSRVPPATPPDQLLPEPTPLPTPIPVDQTLMGRIKQGRAAVEGIDLYQSDIVYPQIDNEIMLDELPQ